MTRLGGTIDELSIDIRTLIDSVEKAASGHPGIPMGAASVAYVLWTRHLRYDSADPDWIDRDRFVLSAGHGSMLLYSLLFLTGYGLTLDDLKHFRRWESRTPGQPERGVTRGVEATTEYRDAVLPPAVDARVSVEAASSFGWERYVGPGGATIAVDRFGASAPGPEVMAHYGFTVEHVIATAKAVLAPKASS